MKTIELEVKGREETGKGPNRRLRAQGFVPAVVYGSTRKSVNVVASTKTLTKILSGHNENAIITFKSPLAEVNGKHVLIKDWAKDVMTRLPIHVDFFEIDLTKSVRVKVPLNFVGKAKGLAEGGLVSPIVREVEVQVLPTNIPEHIDVDVSNLGVGDSIHIEELVVASGIEKVFNENYTIVTCTYIKEEVIAAPVAAGAEGATAAEPEVIAKGKKEEGAEGEAGAKPAPGGAAKAAAPAKGGDKK